MAIEVEIPIYADEPPHFLLWAVDEIMPILLGLGVGILMGHIFIATVISFVVSHFYKKFREAFQLSPAQYRKEKKLL